MNTTFKFLNYNLWYGKNWKIGSKTHYLITKLGWAENYQDQSKNLLEANININGIKACIFTTHLTFSPSFVDTQNKILEAKVIAKNVKNKKQFILAGYFNSHPDTKVIKTISKMALSVGDLKSSTWTKHHFSYRGFQENALKWRIDYIFVNRDIKFDNFTIHDVNFSDHLPLSVFMTIS